MEKVSDIEPVFMMIAALHNRLYLLVSGVQPGRIVSGSLRSFHWASRMNATQLFGIAAWRLRDRYMRSTRGPFIFLFFFYMAFFNRFYCCRFLRSFCFFFLILFLMWRGATSCHTIHVAYMRACECEPTRCSGAKLRGCGNSLQDCLRSVLLNTRPQLKLLVA